MDYPFPTNIVFLCYTAPMNREELLATTLQHFSRLSSDLMGLVEQADEYDVDLAFSILSKVEFEVSRMKRFVRNEAPYGQRYCKQHRCFHPMTLVWWHPDNRQKNGLGFKCAAKRDGSENTKRRALLKQESPEVANPLLSINFDSLRKVLKRKFKLSTSTLLDGRIRIDRHVYVNKTKLTVDPRPRPKDRFANSDEEANQLLVISAIESALRSARNLEPEANWSYVEDLTNEQKFAAIVRLQELALSDMKLADCGKALTAELQLNSTAANVAAATAVDTKQE